MKKSLLWTAVIVFFGLAGFSIKAVLGFNKAKALIEQAICLPSRGAIAFEFKINGSVEPRNQLNINPQVAGRIEKIAVNEGDNVKKGEVLAWMSSTDRATIMDAVNSSDQEEKTYWETAYKATPIVAPLNGFIISRGKEPGQSVTASDVILVMADKLIIEANVDETDLRYIKLNQKVEIVLDAYPEATYQGTIEHIAYQSEVINNVTVYKVKIQPLTVPKVFRAGMTATVNVVISKKVNALLLPMDVVLGSTGRKFVKLKSGKVDYKVSWKGITPLAIYRISPVETGIDDGKNVEIISGLSEVDTVMTTIATFSNSSAPTTKSSTPGLMSPPKGGVPGPGGP